MGLNLTTAPTREPLELPIVKDHVGLAESDASQNRLLTGLIRTARAYSEKVTGRAWVTQSWTLTLDCFHTRILLPKPPLISVTSITYIDSDGDSTILSSSLYDVSTAKMPGVIEPAYNQSWPTTRSDQEAVSILYQCGYGTTDAAIPADAVAAMLLMIGHWFENREAVVTGTIATTMPQSATALLHGLKTGIVAGGYDMKRAGAT